MTDYLQIATIMAGVAAIIAASEFGRAAIIRAKAKLKFGKADVIRADAEMARAEADIDAFEMSLQGHDDADENGGSAPPTLH